MFSSFSALMLHEPLTLTTSSENDWQEVEKIWFDLLVLSMMAYV
jgi:hypothetical protein